MYAAQLFQLTRQLLIDAAKPAVGEDSHHVSTAHLSRNSRDNLIRISQLARGLTRVLNAIDHRACGESFVFRHSFWFEDWRDHNFIRHSKAVDQLSLQHFAA